MNKNVIFLSAVVFFSCVLNASEPSAFGAGDLNKDNPYGLSSSEEIILQNKKNLKKVLTTASNQENLVHSLRERIDGLQSIVEGLGVKSHENKHELTKLLQADQKSKEEYVLLEKKMLEINESQNTSIEQLKKAVSELSLVIDSINGSYVRQEEFNKLIEDVNQFKSLVSKELEHSSKTTKSTSSGLDAMESAQVYTEAKALYDKQYYTDAIKYYEHLIKKQYKPAYAHFMIGTMYYKRKNYADAIAYFKKSNSIYSKASYTPELMLYTAISMEETDDKQNAKAFYEAVIAKYPNDKEAQEAQKRLKSLK